MIKDGYHKMYATMPSIQVSILKNRFGLVVVVLLGQSYMQTICKHFN